MRSPSDAVAGIGRVETVTPLTVIAALAVPGWFIKQCINWQQLSSAAARLVAYERDKSVAASGGTAAGSKLQELSKTQ